MIYLLMFLPNTSNIATNTSNITTNITNISTNTTDIATNTTDIYDLSLVVYSGAQGNNNVSVLQVEQNNTKYI